MHQDLEAIVATDETARARVAAAERRAHEQLEAEQAARERQRAERQRTLADEVDRQIRQVIQEADREIEALRRRQERYLARRAEAARSSLDAAARAYAAILRDGPSGRGAR